MKTTPFYLTILCFILISCGDNQLDGLDQLINSNTQVINPLSQNPITGKFYLMGVYISYGNGTNVTFDPPINPDCPLSINDFRSNYEFFSTGFSAFNMKIPPAQGQVDCQTSTINNIPYIYEPNLLRINLGGEKYILKEVISNKIYMYKESEPAVDLDGDTKLDRTYLYFKK